MRPLFVTGATSHSGCHLVERLVADGERPRCLTRSAEKAARLPTGACEVVVGDLERVEQTAEQLRGCRAALHLGHIRNARPIVEACRRAGVGRLIAISSTRKFTRFPDMISERVVEGERVVEESGLDWTILRPSMIFGDAGDGNIAGLVEALRRRAFFPLVGGGRVMMQPVFVLDLVDAVLRAAERPETVGRAYEIAGPEALSLRELLEMIRRETGSRTRLLSVPRWLALPAARALDLVRGRREAGLAPQIRRLAEDKTFDISAARRELDFEPRSFGEALRVKLEWLKEGR